MKLKYDPDNPDLGDDPLNWMVCHMAVEIEEAGGSVDYEAGEVDLVLTGNGVELDPLMVFMRVMSRYEDDVDRAARKLLEAKASDIMNEVGLLCENIHYKGHELFPSDYEDDEEW